MWHFCWISRVVCVPRFVPAHYGTQKHRGLGGWTIYASCAVLLEESVSAMINPLTPTNTTLQLAVTMGDYPRSNIVCCRGLSIFEKIINSSIFGESTLPQDLKNPNDS